MGNNQPFQGFLGGGDKRHDDIKKIRREMVAKLFEAGYTITQVHKELQDPDSTFYNINPETGEPWAIGTIQNDERALLEMTKAEQQKKSRQLRVKQLRIRGLSDVEIYTAMSNPSSPSFMLNPVTQKPYSLSTVQRDLQDVREWAITESMQSMEQHVANQYDELQAVKRSAWSKGAHSIVLRAIELEMKLLGTARPEMHEHFLNATDDQTTSKQMLRDRLSRLRGGGGIGKDAETIEVALKKDTPDDTAAAS